MSHEPLLLALPAILADAGVPGAEIRGIMLYGSRVSGQARPDSDLDALILLGQGAPSFEFHGSRAGVPVDLELRFRTEEALRAEIDSGDLLRAVALVKGRIVLDQDGALAGLRGGAHAALELLSLKLQSGLEPAPLLALLRITAVELRRSLGAIADRDPLAAIARLSEFMLDLYLYTEIFQRLRGHETASLGTGVLLLTGPRPARLLQTEKFPPAPWFLGLKEDVSRILPRACSDGSAFIEQAFAAMDHCFRECTGEPLLEPGHFTFLSD